jgi:TRAP-type C4-dicarboxylate transport system permease small subunit
MKAEAKKILAIASFATSMVALAALVGYAFYLRWFFASDELIALDVSVPVLAVPAMLVALGFYLGFKRKHHMF